MNRESYAVVWPYYRYDSRAVLSYRSTTCYVLNQTDHEGEHNALVVISPSAVPSALTSTAVTASPYRTLLCRASRRTSGRQASSWRPGQPCGDAADVTGHPAVRNSQSTGPCRAALTVIRQPPRRRRRPSPKDVVRVVGWNRLDGVVVAV